MRHLIKREFIPLLIISIATFISAKALFHTGFFRTIDDITVIRIVYMAKELIRHDWIHNMPVRWSGELAHGFGYPLYLFYAPLPYYLGALLYMTGKFSHIVATKWVYVLPLLIGPFFFYWAARQKMTKLAATAATLFFVFFPYRGFDTYIRGGVGEALAMAFLPGLFAGIFLFEKNKHYGYIISVFLGLALISHNVSGLMIIALVILYGLVFHFKHLSYWLHILLGLGLSAFFWLPSYYYLSIVKVNYSNQNTGQIIQLLEPYMNLLRIQIPFVPEVKYSGILFIIIITGIIASFLAYRNKTTKHARELLFWGFISIFIYSLLSKEFIAFWQITLPVSRILQFPWRVFVVLSFIMPFFTGLWINIAKPAYIKYLGCIFVLIACAVFITAFHPKEYSFFYEYTAEDTGICATSWGDEYIPVWVNKCAGTTPSRIIEVNETTKILSKEISPLSIHAQLDSKNGTYLRIFHYYFPGWIIKIDNKEVPVDYHFSDQGIFKTTVPPGKHRVDIQYGKTTLMWIADSVTILSLVFLLSELVFFNRSFSFDKKVKRN